MGNPPKASGRACPKPGTFPTQSTNIRVAFIPHRAPAVCWAVNPDRGNIGPQNKYFWGKGRAGSKAKGVGKAPNRESGNTKP